MNGVATFSNLSVSAAGASDTLVAKSSGLTSTTSSSFAVASPAPSPTPTVTVTPESYTNSIGYSDSTTPTVTATPTSTTPTPSATPQVVQVSLWTELSNRHRRRSSVLPLASSLSLSVAANETTGRVLKVAVPSCQVLAVNAPTGVTVTLYHMPQITTTTASYTGAVVGPHYDPLVPITTTSNQVCPSGYLGLGRYRCSHWDCAGNLLVLNRRFAGIVESS